LKYNGRFFGEMGKFLNGVLPAKREYSTCANGASEDFEGFWGKDFGDVVVI
jgi:hypothetical protein